MKNSETQVRTVLGDTIVALCRSMLSQHAHVQVEGLLGITLNSEEIFLVNISRSIANTSSSSSEGIDVAGIIKPKLESADDNLDNDEVKFSNYANSNEVVNRRERLRGDGTKLRKRRRKPTKTFSDEQDDRLPLDENADSQDNKLDDFELDDEPASSPPESDNFSNSVTEDETYDQDGGYDEVDFNRLDASDGLDHKGVISDCLSDAQAMYGSYNNDMIKDMIKDSHVNQNQNRSNQSKVSNVTCDKNNHDQDSDMNLANDRITVKTEVMSDEESQSNSGSTGNSDQDLEMSVSDSLPTNLQWPFSFSRGFVSPSVCIPSVHVPNIANMILGETNGNSEAGRSINPEWFGSSGKNNKSFHSNNDDNENVTSTNSLANHGRNSRGVRRWTKRQRGPETIVDLMLAEQNMTNSKTCPLCGRTFGEAWIMRRHMMVHTGAKAYQCHVCHKKFTRKDVLSAHMKVHASSEKYGSCDASSTLNSDDHSDFMRVSRPVNFPWNHNQSTTSSHQSTMGPTTASDDVATTGTSIHSSAMHSTSYSTKNDSTTLNKLITLSKALPESSDVDITAMPETAMAYAASSHLLSSSVTQSIINGGQLSNVRL